MGGEISFSNLVWEFITISLKVYLYPRDVMSSGIGMGDLLAHAYCHLPKLTLLERCGNIDNRHMFFRFPVRRLQQVYKFLHCTTSRYILDTISSHLTNPAYLCIHYYMSWLLQRASTCLEKNLLDKIR